MNLNHLRHFYFVAKEGSFSLASETLCVSQPAVSKSVRELEKYFEVSLLSRSTKRRNMRLTHEGRRLFEYARSLFAIERTAIDDMQALRELHDGVLRLGATPTVANYWLAPYINNFKTLYPNVLLSVQVASTPVISEALIDYEIDLGIIEGGEVSSTLINTMHWFDEEMLFITAYTGHKSSAMIRSELEQSVWLLREQGAMTRDVVERILADNQIKPQKIIEIGSNEAIAKHVEAGLGLSLLPKATVADLIQLNTLSEIKLKAAKNMRRPLLILNHPEDNLQSFAASAFQVILSHKIS
ncbi:hypothetical protein LCGC14_0655560 [marine sediment metagenome]|uniref:HTH lysR-type domain-containing protein n=1 Tax=marine sediment metagenome TaxID=412755 RepID=A0A0F9R092_9ZZZZ|nr:LysR family transcriptional regulator [Methylophaga sp.]